MDSPTLWGITVRGFGYTVIHAASVPVTDLLPMKDFGVDFIGVLTPVVARCGTSVRSVTSAVVMMPPNTKITCPTCRRLKENDNAQN